MDGKPLTHGIDHLGLTVRNLNVTRDFFIQCLGWTPVRERPNYPAAFVSDGHIILTLWQVANPDRLVEFDRKTNVGLHHLALRVGSRRSAQRDLCASFRMARRRG
ncbi:MAG: glyoxalase [Caballeronia mineralivorans]|jgi:catechol 2,3-dioxygenase-like lactoylglutathione lyase family enzyme|nr:glyoxalase [Caballeronia mineralivorans]